jgi:NAD(P)-dependent dehydrogenase (short-subunit alcohol dehydrogenase family)
MAERRLENRVAVITGGASGIGRATAELFAAEGAKVVIGDLQVTEGSNLASAIGGTFIETDVSSSKSVDHLVKSAHERFGRLDIMYNNAGIGITMPLLKTDDETYLKTIRIDLDGVFYGIRAAGRIMTEQRRGAIVNTASVAGLRGSPGLSAYNAAKGGVVLLTKNAALEFAPFGVRVNCVCPGVIDTPLVRNLLGHIEGIDKIMAAMHPLGRIGQPIEIARAVLFLASDEASFVTGHALAVDGGICAGAGGGGDNPFAGN